MKPLINLFDVDFVHSPSATATKVPHCFDYVRNQVSFDGITLFVNDLIFYDVVDNVKSKYKIAWLLEPPDVKPVIYEHIKKVEHKFDYILTFDPELLNSKTNKYKFIPYAGCWIADNRLGVYQKSKACSLLYSNKQFCEGHRLRHEIANSVFPNIDLYGAGAGRPIESKEQALIDYRFSIIIENQKLNNFFTEKLIDAFATGTVPVYWGCNNIGDYFDINGIITFSSLNELKNIIPTLTEEKYKSMLPSIEKNLELCRQYTTIEDWMYLNVFEKLELL